MLRRWSAHERSRSIGAPRLRPYRVAAVVQLVLVMLAMVATQSSAPRIMEMLFLASGGTLLYWLFRGRIGRTASVAIAIAEVGGASLGIAALKAVESGDLTTRSAIIAAIGVGQAIIIVVIRLIARRRKGA